MDDWVYDSVVRGVFGSKHIWFRYNIRAPWSAPYNYSSITFHTMSWNILLSDFSYVHCFLEMVWVWAIFYYLPALPALRAVGS